MIGPEMVAVKKPGTGSRRRGFAEVVGRRSARAIAADTVLDGRRRRLERAARVRKVCVVVGSRANYSSIKSAMQAIEDHAELELQLVVGASALLDRYGPPSNVIERDGFKPVERVFMLIEGETPSTMAKSTGLGLLELPTAFERLQPDIVVTVGDRFETMATALAAAYMNIPLAHTMGGEVSGTIDESIRHAVTKFAHIHFPACSDARGADRQAGRAAEDTVFNVGCPRIDLVAEVLAKPWNGARSDLFEVGVGSDLDLEQPFADRLAAPGDDRVRRRRAPDRRDADGGARGGIPADRALAERRRRLGGHRARHPQAARARASTTRCTSSRTCRPRPTSS